MTIPMVNLGPTPSSPSNLINPTVDSEKDYPTSSTGYPNPSTLTRHEILQTKVRGYREETFWGTEHHTHEKIQHFSDEEFDRFIEEVKLDDSDLYWGAQY